MIAFRPMEAFVMRFALRLCCAVILSAGLFGMAQGPAPAASAPELADRIASANTLYMAQNFVAALPVYEELHAAQPKENLWRERLAMCLLATSTGDASKVERAHGLLLEARAAGDNSNLLQVLLERLEAPQTPANQPQSPGMDAFRRAEKAFSSGDMPGAIKLYEEAYAADPRLYEAPLYAGDAEFKQGHYAEAEGWFAKAVAINPNRETALRYWGDCLMKERKPKDAELKFIDALLAEPYTRATRLGLKQWSDLTKTRIAAPEIKLPLPPAQDGKGGTTINIDPAQNNSSATSANLVYAMSSATFRNDGFAKAFPDEKVYRHSLKEEAESIRAALAVLKEQKIAPDKLDVTWRLLQEIEEDGMLECWILLDNPDQGVARDYVAFREGHRDLMRAYVAKYDVHPM
jgi:tetratricopeptide (TPR) repeat protein